MIEIAAPPALSDVALEKWREITAPNGWAREAACTQADEIAEYCRLHARKANADAKCAEHGDVVADPRGFPVESPWLRVANNCRTAMLKIAHRHQAAVASSPPVAPIQEAERQPVTGNKADLAAALGVSLPTLSGWIMRYRPDFPVESRGSNGRSYTFDFAKVFEFLRLRQAEEQASKAERDESLAQLRLPFDLPGVEPPPKATSTKDELLAWELRKRQRMEAEAAGALVPAAQISEALRAVLGRLSRDQAAFLRQIGREQNWPDAYIRQLEQRLDNQQRATVAVLRDYLTAPEAARAAL